MYIALRQITGVYYAHPYAWDEIGFGGPAYPRGYFALNHGAPEPWEAARGRRPTRTRSASMKLHVHLSSDWILDTEMREYPPREAVDFCIVGTGAGGGVLAQRLARFGFSVVALEAGPWHDTERDMVSDEAGSGRLYWNDLRITGGTEPLELGANNSGRGVGGSTIHYAGFCPRLHPSDFRVASLDGVAADWPLSYDELEPYYERWSASTRSRARRATPGASRTATRTRRSRRAPPARS